MKVKVPPHILRTISPKKFKTIYKWTDLFVTHTDSKILNPFIDKWGYVKSEVTYKPACWKQADPISEGDWSGHSWVHYSVYQYSGVHKGERVRGVDELKPNWFYIIRTGIDNGEIKVVAAERSWDEIIARGCKLLGYLPTGSGTNILIDGNLPIEYPTQMEFFTRFREVNGKSMCGS